MATTRRMRETILAVEEEPADDLVNLLEKISNQAPASHGAWCDSSISLRSLDD